MGKGQRAKREQAAAATAALLTKQSNQASPLSTGFSASAQPFVPGGFTASGPKSTSNASPSSPSKDPSRIDYSLMSKFFARDQQTRVRLLTAFAEQSEDLAAAMAELSIVSQDSVPTFNAAELAHIARRYGVGSVEGSLIVSHLMKALSSRTTSTASTSISTEVAFRVLASLQSTIEKDIEPVAVYLLPEILQFQGHKTPLYRELSSQIVANLSSSLCPISLHIIYPTLLDAISHDKDWRCRVAALEIIDALAKNAKEGISPLLPHIMPDMSECMKDAKKQVAVAATTAMNTACSFIHNDDISHLVPQLVSVIARPEEIGTTVDLLLETTFVATVDAPTLALITPLLSKCLRDRSSLMKRKASKIVENMCKLVQNPSDVEPFVPLLLPNLEKAIDEVSDPEVCEVATVARDVLTGAMGEGVQTTHRDVTDFAEKLKQTLRSLLEVELAKKQKAVEASNAHQHEVIGMLVDHMAGLLCALVLHGAPGYTAVSVTAGAEDAWRHAAAYTSSKLWISCIAPFVPCLLPNHDNVPEADVDEASDSQAPVNEDAAEFARSFRLEALNGIPDMEFAVEDDTAEYICNFEFSLAFGGKILLHNTFLRLAKGHKYGIMGKNGVGKTTLMTNIGCGNIDGFPDDLRTVYVQHDDPTAVDEGQSILDEIMAYRDILSLGVTPDDARRALSEIGFTDLMISSSRSALSGGWKMKLLIVRAMLCQADILLLDEPTNHLDAASVQWLADYLQSQKDLTCLIVSHDPAFLDQVISDVIHYEQKTLVYYKGSLKDFVAIHPEAQYYYELSGSTLTFTLPVPEGLDGVTSKSRAVLKMDNVTFTYPGASAPTLTDASVKLTLGSRVGVTGVNGAGKSTLIRLLVQEYQPDVDANGNSIGEVWKHHNLRLAYVAQHSFFHIEQHLEESPVDYIKWRFADGVDKEDMAKANMKISEEEAAEAIAQRKMGDVVDVVGRRKNGRTMEYECTFVGQTAFEDNIYIPLEKMVEMGLQKQVTQCDNRIAAAVAGLAVRPLVTKEIQAHLDAFNLEAEFGTFGKIKRLSGGQKVKLVFAAAMWNKPHILVLDEPTNYLDREALAALTEAIKLFQGGVVIISHNSAFTEALCSEIWHVEGGKCHVAGEGVADEEGGSTKVKKSSTSATRKFKSSARAGEMVSDVAAAQASKESKAGSLEADSVGNVNSTKTVMKEQLKNPRTLEYLNKTEIRKLTKCALAAGVPLKEYVAKINKDSPEWKWLGKMR